MTAGPHGTNTPDRAVARRVATITLALLGVAVIVGLGLTLLLRPSIPRSAAHTPSDGTSAPTTGPTPTPSGTPTRIPAPTSSAVLDLSDRSAYRFASPTGNIICLMGPSTVRCNAQNRSWTPPAPAGCQQAHDDLAIDAGGRATVACHTDSIRQAPDGGAIPTLAYGTAVKMGAVLCISQSNGISCAQSMTGDSIFLARERYEVNIH